MQAHAAEFPVPLLLVQGSADRLVSPAATAAFAKAVPADKVTYKVWEGFYHETHNEPEKQQVLQYMVAWLDQHTQMVYLQPSRKENPV
jgi:alpha-beta hydrolase superfamily lysophospholipase